MTQITITMEDRKAIVNFKVKEELSQEDIMNILLSLRSDTILNLIDNPKIKMPYPLDVIMWDGKKYLYI